MKKKIDAVAFMRQIRDQLSDRYRKSPEAEENDLEKVRKKYPFKQPAK